MNVEGVDLIDGAWQVIITLHFLVSSQLSATK
jgi:hypothetical protein